MLVRKRHPTPADLGLEPHEGRILQALASPRRIQEFVIGLNANFEESGDTLRSVRGVLRYRRAHCIEAALLAAAALWLQGEPPLLMDLTASGDSDHVVAVFRRHGCWGAISKSNHVWLRWRDPVYRSLRELAMSYFHEYTCWERKTLRGHSDAFDLRKFPPKAWVTNRAHCWEVGAALDDAPHHRLITAAQARTLAPRDAMEQRANDLIQYESRDPYRARRY
ncbi:hypothetical protein [Reyranella sp.]|uniref:hypothetical protein n=1 Tax=Reyranella sp. TaxID=1929291 RepID=UPI003BAC13B3